jgi:hypothetical protein
LYAGIFNTGIYSDRSQVPFEPPTYYSSEQAADHRKIFGVPWGVVQRAIHKTKTRTKKSDGAV